jgi:hypothetical protein
LANAAPNAPRQPLDKARIPRKDEDEDDDSDDDDDGVDDDEQLLLLLFTVMSFFVAASGLWIDMFHFCFVVCRRPKKFNSNLKTQPNFRIQFGKYAIFPRIYTLNIAVSRDQSEHCTGL